MTRRRFEDKVVIVTGASTGLGPILSRMLVEEGAKVLMAARRVELVEAEAASIGGNAVAVQADVTSEADVAAMVDAAMDRWGQVDVLMNNAAVPGKDLYIWEQTLENWNATFAVDVTAAMLCSREVLRRSMMERKTGAIVNFSSTAGWNGLPRKSHYSAAKGSLRILTKVIATEVGPYGIRCNCLVPGAIETQIMADWLQRTADEKGLPLEQWREEWFSNIPLKAKISTAQDVANAALFLASDEARTITGQSINVDAGGVMVG
ncbi:MAG TPA: SDR family oxidoreductase [Sphingobium sp.]|uniref:SDR family NAD(P)-dependent oxidoreductase n=1 Tax=Sphingobium sp. TaxID=1912891 RepID=UPI002ED240C0